MIKNTKPTSKDLYFNELKSENDQFGSIVFYVELTQFNLKKEKSSIYLWQSRKWEIIHINEDKRPKTSFKSRGSRVFVRRKNYLLADEKEASYNVVDNIAFCENVFVYDIIWVSENTKETYLQVFSDKHVGTFEKPNTLYIPIFKNDDFDKTYQSDYDDSFNQSLEYTPGVIAKLTYKFEKIVLVSEHFYENSKYNFNDVYLKLAYEPVVICTDYYRSIHGLTTSHFQLSEKLGKSCEHHILQVTTRRGSCSELSLSLSEISLIKSLYRKNKMQAKERYTDLPDDVLVIDCLDEVGNSNAPNSTQTTDKNSFDDDFEDIVWDESSGMLNNNNNNNKHGQINKETEDPKENEDLKSSKFIDKKFSILQIASQASNLKTNIFEKVGSTRDDILSENSLNLDNSKNEKILKSFVNSLVEKSEGFKQFNVEERVLSTNAAHKKPSKTESVHVLTHFQPIQAQTYNRYSTSKQNKNNPSINSLSANLVEESNIISICDNKEVLNAENFDFFSFTDFDNLSVENPPQNRKYILESNIFNDHNSVKCDININSAMEPLNLKNIPTITESFSKKKENTSQHSMYPMEESCLNNEDDKSFMNYVNYVSSVNKLKEYDFKHADVEENNSNIVSGLQIVPSEKTIGSHIVTLCKPIEAKSCISFSTFERNQKHARLPGVCNLALEPEVSILCNKNESQNVSLSIIFNFDQLFIKNRPPDRQSNISPSFLNDEHLFNSNSYKDVANISKISHFQAPHVVNPNTERNTTDICNTPGSKNDETDLSMFKSDIDALKSKIYTREINTFDVFLESNFENKTIHKDQKNLDGKGETSELIVKNIKRYYAKKNLQLDVINTPTFYVEKPFILLEEESPIISTGNLQILPLETSETFTKMKNNDVEVFSKNRNKPTSKTYYNKSRVIEDIHFKVNNEMEIDIKSLKLLDEKNNLDSISDSINSESPQKNTPKNGNKIENTLENKTRTNTYQADLTKILIENISKHSNNLSTDNDGDKGDNDGDKGDNDGDKGDNDKVKSNAVLKDTNNLEIGDASTTAMILETKKNKKNKDKLFKDDNIVNDNNKNSIENNTIDNPNNYLGNSQESKDLGDILHNDVSMATKKISHRNSYFIKLKASSESSSESCKSDAISQVETCNTDLILRVETAPSEIVFAKKNSLKNKVKKVFLKFTNPSKLKKKEPNSVENTPHCDNDNTLEPDSLSSQLFSKALSKNTTDKKLYSKRSNSLDSYINGDTDNFLSSSNEINLRKKKLAHHASTVVKSKDYSPEVVARETELELESVRKQRRKYLSQPQDLSSWILEHYDALQEERNMQIGKISVPEVFLINQKFQSSRSSSDLLIGKLSIPPAFSLEGLDKLGSIVVTDEIEF